MKLLIHDYSKEEWDRLSSGYSDWHVISDNGSIKPCVGCFGCWIKTPGQCVIKDGYDRMGALIHEADEVLVISRYTYGGFSSFVKNVIDRSIGWVLPFFEINNNEMHHKKRYPEDKPFSFIFRGNDLSDEDRENAKKYVTAVCRNLHGIIKSIDFTDDEQNVRKPVTKIDAKADISDKVLLLNCSTRGENSNSKIFLNKLSQYISDDTESINLSHYLNKADELLDIVGHYDRIVLGMPLYVDGIPSATLKLMEILKKWSSNGKKHIYVTANMGFYESAQIVNLLSMVKAWCKDCGYEYGGGLAIGAGEMMTMMMKSDNIEKGPAKNIASGFKALAKAIDDRKNSGDIYADAYHFPRFMYMFAANLGWPVSGKQNGLKKKDLYKGAD